MNQADKTHLIDKLELAAAKTSTRSTLRLRIAEVVNYLIPVEKLLTAEQDRAIEEAFCNTFTDEYFKVRPQLDSLTNRRLYEAGFRNGWSVPEAQRLDLALSTRVHPEKMVTPYISQEQFDKTFPEGAKHG